jgi:hypothetical protein
MTFQAVVRARDDGDYDVIAAIQIGGLQDELNYIPNQWGGEIVEYMNKCAPNDSFSVIEIESVTDVIGGENGR